MLYFTSVTDSVTQYPLPHLPMAAFVRRNLYPVAGLAVFTVGPVAVLFAVGWLFGFAGIAMYAITQ